MCGGGGGGGGGGNQNLVHVVVEWPLAWIKFLASFPSFLRLSFNSSINKICPYSLFLMTQNNMGSFFTSLCLLLILVVQNCFCNVILLQNLFARVESLEEEGASKDKRIGVLELKIEHLTQSRVCERITVNHFYWITLDSGINIALRLLIFWLFSRGYGLIPDSIEPILVV